LVKHIFFGPLIRWWGRRFSLATRNCREMGDCNGNHFADAGPDYSN